MIKVKDTPTAAKDTQMAFKWGNRSADSAASGAK
jgi:hypothetical protein